MLRILRELLHPIAQLRLVDAQVLRVLRIRYASSLISRTASSLNSRVNFRLCMTHLRSHCHTKLGVFGTGCSPDPSIAELEEAKRARVRFMCITKSKNKDECRIGII